MDRAERLIQWLHLNGARKVWSRKIENDRVTCWSIQTDGERAITVEEVTGGFDVFASIRNRDGSFRSAATESEET